MEAIRRYSEHMTAVSMAAAVFIVSASGMAFAQPFVPLPDEPPIPDDNPMTPAKIELGKQLFFDPRLSSTGTVSCNSCHNVMAGGDDQRPTSMGAHGRVGPRNAPTVWNSAFLSVQFWDGRAATLEEQAMGPILNPLEMAMTDEAQVLETIKGIPGYVDQFDEVFGEITYLNIAKAIAAYERTLITLNSPVDRYLEGDKDALSSKEVRGMELVQELGCQACHFGTNYVGPDLPMGEGFYQRFPMFTDNEYVGKYDLMSDKGRYEVTGKEDDKHMFRVQTWRNVALTAPYFHNGSVWTLDEAVRVMARTQLDRELSDEQTEAIVAFLKAQTGEFPAQTMPRLPPTPGASSLKELIVHARDE